MLAPQKGLKVLREDVSQQVLNLGQPRRTALVALIALLPSVISGLVVYVTPQGTALMESQEHIPGNVKLWESPGTAGGFPK